MDQNQNTPKDFHTSAPKGPAEDMVLGSRREAIAALRSAVVRQTGPVLLTGAAGVGKSWLWHRFTRELQHPWRWVGIDLSPGDRAGDLHRLIAHAVGLTCKGEASQLRTAVGDFLTERRADGESWGLVIDETQCVGTDLLEEVRILANRLRTSDGFAALIVVGHTGLARRLMTPQHASLAARLAEHIHLRPLDAEEAAQLVGSAFPTLRNEVSTLEKLHRDSGGNPQWLLSLASRIRSREALPETRVAPTLVSTPELPDTRPAIYTLPESEPVPTPVLGPSKPPLHVEEGLIEVGWAPSDEFEEETSEESFPFEQTASAMSEPESEPVPPSTEEMIDDRYAALQAWNEWARNQGRAAVDGTLPGADSGAYRSSRDDSLISPGNASTGALPSFWADQEHAFAPYSQLFSRLKPSKDKT